MNYESFPKVLFENFPKPLFQKLYLSGILGATVAVLGYAGFLRLAAWVALLRNNTSGCTEAYHPDVNIEVCLSCSVETFGSCVELQTVSDTITLDFQRLLQSQDKVQQFSYPAWLLGLVLNLEDLRESTKQMNRLAEAYKSSAQVIEDKWAILPDKEKNMVKEIVYSFKEVNNTSNKTFFSASFFKVFSLPFFVLSNLLFYRNRLKQLNLGAKAYLRAKKLCQEARYNFIDSVLNEIEKEDLTYQQVLSDTLDEVISENANPGDTGVLKLEDTREWLRNLSNKALD